MRRPRVAASVFVLYAVGILAVTIFPVQVHPWTRAPWWAVIELIPFHVPPLSFALNIGMFVPFGVLVPLLWPVAGSAFRLSTLALATSAAIELTQLALWLTLGNYRTVDVNDLIANTAGGLLGLAILRVTTTASRPGRSPRAWSRRPWRRPAGSSSTRRDSR
jgi:glycopeptide antibiotics resistance protein